MPTQLFIEVSDCSNSKVLRIFDTSSYCEETIENYLIEVLPVNKSKWATFHVAKNFSLATNASSLGYKKATEQDNLIELPDGIYEIKQSYKPNIQTVQHFLHLRTISLRRKLRREWDKLVDNTCKLSQEEFYKNRDKLREIEEYILAAKFKIEDCHKKDEGKEIYEYAIKLLERYSNECQC